MRERLIELLKSPHKAEQLRQMGVTIGGYEDDCVEAMIADYLIANGVILPPCKVGDTVFEVVVLSATRKVVVRDAKISQISTETGELLNSCCVLGRACKSKAGISFDFDDFGKTVFLTREEAEKALKESEGK